MRVRNRIDIEEEMLEVDENAGEYQGDEEVSTFKLTSTLLQYMSRTSAEHFSLKIPSEVSRCFEVRANFNVKTKYFDSFLISFTVDRFRFCGVDDSISARVCFRPEMLPVSAVSLLMYQVR